MTAHEIGQDGKRDRAHNLQPIENGRGPIAAVARGDHFFLRGGGFFGRNRYFFTQPLNRRDHLPEHTLPPVVLAQIARLRSGRQLLKHPSGLGEAAVAEPDDGHREENEQQH